MQSLLFHCVVVSVAALGLMMATPALGDDAAPQPRPNETPPAQHGDRQGPRKPPQAAYDACTDTNENEECVVDFGQRTIEGKCVPDRDDGTLFCRPNHPPGPPPQQGS